MASNVGNIRIEPVDVTWEIEEQWEITTVADVASSLNNRYFKIYDGDNVGYYVWFNVGGAGVDPAPSGLTEIEVAISANATASAVATAAAAAIAAIGSGNKFEASATGAVMLVTAEKAGSATDFSDAAGLSATGFSFVQCQDGGSVDLGYLEGNVEVAFEEQLLEVNAHQTGTTLLADLRQGVSAEITLTLKECDAANLKEMFARAAGGTHTPGGGTEVFGWGKSKQGMNTVVQARRLVFHPVALADSNKTRDICFWKAYPLPETLVFSGEDPQTLGVTFKTYLDDAKPEEIQQFAYGDWTQYVPVYP